MKSLSPALNEKRRNRMLFVIIVAATLRYVNSALIIGVYETIFLVNAATVKPMKITLQGFGFTNAFQRTIALYVFDQEVDALEGFLVLCLPVQVIIPSLISPCFFTHRNPQSTRERFLFLP